MLKEALARHSGGPPCLGPAERSSLRSDVAVLQQCSPIWTPHPQSAVFISGPIITFARGSGRFSRLLSLSTPGCSPPVQLTILALLAILICSGIISPLFKTDRVHLNRLGTRMLAANLQHAVQSSPCDYLHSTLPHWNLHFCLLIHLRVLTPLLAPPISLLCHCHPHQSFSLYRPLLQTEPTIHTVYLKVVRALGTSASCPMHLLALMLFILSQSRWP